MDLGDGQQSEERGSIPPHCIYESRVIDDGAPCVSHLLIRSRTLKNQASHLVHDIRRHLQCLQTCMQRKGILLLLLAHQKLHMQHDDKKGKDGNRKVSQLENHLHKRKVVSLCLSKSEILFSVLNIS